jgi:hypothetical protein
MIFNKFSLMLSKFDLMFSRFGLMFRLVWLNPRGGFHTIQKWAKTEISHFLSICPGIFTKVDLSSHTIFRNLLLTGIL